MRLRQHAWVLWPTSATRRYEVVCPYQLGLFPSQTEQLPDCWHGFPLHQRTSASSGSCTAELPGARQLQSRTCPHATDCWRVADLSRSDGSRRRSSSLRAARRFRCVATVADHSAACGILRLPYLGLPASRLKLLLVPLWTSRCTLALAQWQSVMQELQLRDFPPTMLMPPASPQMLRHWRLSHLWLLRQAQVALLSATWDAPPSCNT